MTTSPPAGATRRRPQRRRRRDEGRAWRSALLLIDILSPTAEAWDRGGKFESYQRVASLQESVLIAPDRPRVEQYARRTGGQWLLTVTTGLRWPRLASRNRR